MSLLNSKTKRLHQHSQRTGMTMIEMLVAVTILAVLMLAFGKILSKSQQVITASQINMNANANATTIAQVLRDDIKKATQNGFICITQMSNEDSRPRLIIATAGMIQSKFSTITGSAGLSIYGHVDPLAAPWTPLFCRQGWILLDEAILQSASTPFPQDVCTYQARGTTNIYSLPLTYIQNLNRENLNDYLLDWLLNDTNNPRRFPSQLKYPADTLTEINNLWQVLCPGVNKMSIFWTDGTKKNNQLNWYGIAYSPSANHYQSIKKTTTALPPFDPNDKSQIEFKNSTATDAGYRALWTKYNQADWPKAIKICFSVGDKSLTGREGEKDENKYQDYEIVIPVRP